METENLDTRMLSAWLRLSTAICNERVVTNMSYNEALILHILDAQPKDQPVTATDLCEQTRMLKSQMNRTLTGMEQKGYILRERSGEDHRKIYIRFNESCRALFEQEHDKNLRLVHTLLDRYGRGRAEDLISSFNEIAAIAEEVLQ